MSTREDREWDAWIDDHTVHVRCGLTLTHCDCPNDTEDDE